MIRFYIHVTFIYITIYAQENSFKQRGSPMNEPMYSVGPIMKAARKFKKLNQANVAHAIGCSQSALSKMEHNLLIPSAPQWFLFARFTSIPPESLETGIIDRHSPVKFNSAEVSQGFKIPKKYRNARAVKAREIYPFLQSLERENSAQVAEFISSTGLEPEFFLDFDNLVNFQLIADLMSFYIKIGRANSSEIRKIVEVGHNGIYWDHYGVEWQKLSTIEEVLDAYIGKQMFFQTDFKLRREGSGDQLALSYVAEPHLKEFTGKVSDEVVNFLNQYRKYTIENLIKWVLDKEISLNLIQELGPSPFAARFSINPRGREFSS